MIITLINYLMRTGIPLNQANHNPPAVSPWLCFERRTYDWGLQNWLSTKLPRTGTPEIQPFQPAIIHPTYPSPKNRGVDGGCNGDIVSFSDYGAVLCECKSVIIELHYKSGGKSSRSCYNNVGWVEYNRPWLPMTGTNWHLWWEGEQNRLTCTKIVHRQYQTPG